MLNDQCFKGETISREITPTENEFLNSIWILANVTPTFENSAIIGIICQGIDISEKKKIEQDEKIKIDSFKTYKNTSQWELQLM
jgi:hypothetical protein